MKECAVFFLAVILLPALQADQSSYTTMRGGEEERGSRGNYQGQGGEHSYSHEESNSYHGNTNEGQHPYGAGAAAGYRHGSENNNQGGSPVYIAPDNSVPYPPPQNQGPYQN